MTKISGYCFISNTITQDGLKIGYMFREKPIDSDDTGWRFFSGTEDEEYLENEDNIDEYDIRYALELDPSIEQYIHLEAEVDLERNDSDGFDIIKD
ncbi:MAG: DUF2185 domain-containing protein [Bacteroidota bacterium]|nr:DUF2185 domain-containing protein [Bacteroidota bacterium]